MTHKKLMERMAPNPGSVMETTRLSYYAATDATTVMGDLASRRDGLDPDEVEDSRRSHGANVMRQAERTPWYRRLIACVLDPFVLILVFLRCVSVATDVVFATPGTEDAATPAPILGMALVLVMLRFVQETKGADAAAALAASIETAASWSAGPGAHRGRVRRGRGRRHLPPGRR